MTRRIALRALTFLFLFWLLWPRAWLPRGGAARRRAVDIAAEDRDGRSDASPDQVAILALDPGIGTLGAAASLRAAGVPYAVVQTTAAALAHRIIYLPTGERTLPLKRPDIERLRGYVEAGGVLIVQATSRPPFPDLSGVSGVAASRDRRGVALKGGADEGFAFLDQPEELTLPLAGASVRRGIWTAALTPMRGETQPLAFFAEGKDVALTRRLIGKGRVYVLGFDPLDLVMRPRAGRAFDSARVRSNGFEPAADVFPLILRAWYEAFTPGWVRLRGLPGDAKALLLLSHAIESGVSLAGAREWAAWESARGIRSTWFIQTNHSDAAHQEPFYDAGMARDLRAIAASGHELAAHTVVHAAEFENLPRGDGLERRQSYRPSTESGEVWDATQLGEIRVPKEILEQDVSSETVAGYRGPAAAFPEDLDEMLADSGYSWDSSRTAASALSHRPFFMTRWRTLVSESRIVEMPMTFEDELPAKEPPSADDILRVVRAAAADESLVVWQSRPDAANLPRLAEVLDGLPPGARVGPLGPAARWWSARERTEFWLEAPRASKRRRLNLILPPEADAADLSFEFSSPVRRCRPDSPAIQVSCEGRLLRLLRTGGARKASLTLDLE